MKGKLIWSIFWALVGVFVIVVSMIFIPAFGALLAGYKLFLIPLTVLFLLGATLIVLTIDKKIRRMLKGFFLLVGASATGIFFFFILHNFISRWLGIEEPFSFIMVIFVCPLGFLVGAIGNIALFTKKPWLVPRSPSRRR